MLFSLGEGVSGGRKYVWKDFSEHDFLGTSAEQIDSREFAHGGLMATLLDEALGTPVFVQSPAGCATAELSVTYERPLPIPAVVLCRSWVDKAEGRKIWIKGTIEDGNGLVFARGQSLFVKFRERL